MVKTICERGKKCIFLKTEIKPYKREYRGFVITGKQLNYYCTNPKRFKKWEIPRILTHVQKYNSCGFKTTHKLEAFSSVK